MDTPPHAPQSDDKVEQFAASVAHDFNNLLTGILGNLELLQSRAAKAGATNLDSYIQGARNAGSRAAVFSQRLLAFAGRTAQDFSATPVQKLIHDTIDPMCEHGLRITLELAPADATVFCDTAQAEMALHELLTNAIDATTESGEILLRTKIEDKGVVIEIEDTGTGMAEDILRRATEPFFTTRPNGAGKGLGLPIAARFARQSGGTLHITSTIGKGTCVSLILPKQK